MSDRTADILFILVCLGTIAWALAMVLA